MSNTKQPNPSPNYTMWGNLQEFLMDENNTIHQMQGEMK